MQGLSSEAAWRRKMEKPVNTTHRGRVIQSKTLAYLCAMKFLFLYKASKAMTIKT